MNSRTVWASLTLIMAVALSGPNLVDAFNAQTQRSLVRVQLTDFAEGMRAFHEKGLDIAGVDRARNRVDLVLDKEEIAFLSRNGYTVLGTFDTEIGLAPDRKYQTPATVEASLRALNAAYPALTELVSAGKSFEGRDIWALKISNPQIQAREGKPVFFVNGMHHARELMTPEVVLDMADYLLRGYGADPRVTGWVDRNEIWLMPMFNVDGNNKVWTQDPWWRKNVRQGHGTDINRNYAFQWNTCGGSSGFPSAQDYRGEAAGSEPETQVMMNFVKRILPTMSLSLHSYSELVIYPYSCPGQFTPTHEVFETLGNQIAGALPSDSSAGRTYEAGTAPELLYAVDGGDIDWFYHEAQVVPFVIEVNSYREGFQPAYDQWRDRTVQKLRAAWMLMLDRLDGPGVRGLVTDADGQPVGGALVKVTRAGEKVFAQTYKAAADGTFHLILNPGNYHLTSEAPGRVSYEGDLIIGSERTNLIVGLGSPTSP